MDWSSNLIQILLVIQFMPLKDTFSNPSLKARIWMPSLPASVMWMGPNWEAPVLSVPATALWQVWTPGDRLGPRYGTAVVRQRHTCPHCHLSWEQPFKSVHFYILPLPQYSDQILTTVAYIILNWMKIEKQPSTRLVPPPALLLLSPWLFIKPTWDLMTNWHFIQPTNECPEKFWEYCFNWFCKIFGKCRVQCW